MEIPVNFDRDFLVRQACLLAIGCKSRMSVEVRIIS